jgi:hypothetical protein
MEQFLFSFRPHIDPTSSAFCLIRLFYFQHTHSSSAAGHGDCICQLDVRTRKLPPLLISTSSHARADKVFAVRGQKKMLPLIQN